MALACWARRMYRPNISCRLMSWARVVVEVPRPHAAAAAVEPRDARPPTPNPADCRKGPARVLNRALAVCGRWVRAERDRAGPRRLAAASTCAATPPPSEEPESVETGAGAQCSLKYSSPTLFSTEATFGGGVPRARRW